MIKDDLLTLNLIFKSVGADTIRQHRLLKLR